MSNNTVIIPTAGIGSRMGDVCRHVNKGLLPYLHKPLIGHIINKFPSNTRFIIPVGHLSDQVINFCQTMYHNRNLEFVKVENHVGDGSGTATTLKACRSLIDGPFWYVSCDTLWSEPLAQPSNDRDTYFVKKVDQRLSCNYTMIRESNGEINKIAFKTEVQGDGWTAFTGLMHIANVDRFFNTMASTNSVEFIHSLDLNAELRYLESWIDMGNETIYQQEVRKHEPYDFTKTDEITWMDNGVVVKWSKDESNVEKRGIRARYAPPRVLPTGIKAANMLSYDAVQGTTAYDVMHDGLLLDILSWMTDHVWKPVPSYAMAESCREFYQFKSLDRIRSFVQKGKTVLGAKTVNGRKVKSYLDYLDSVSWDLLINDNRTAWIHGDLQFDNIIVRTNGEFRLIDWRPSFGKEPIAGDIYYDMAKLLGGCIIDYSMTKRNQFSAICDGDGGWTVTCPSPRLLTAKKTILEFANSLGMSTRKIEMLVPLIFWNMAPLHAAPFDDLLWCKGLELFSEI